MSIIALRGGVVKLAIQNVIFQEKKIVIENNRNSLTAYYLILIKYVVIIKRIIFHTFNYMSSYL